MYNHHHYLFTEHSHHPERNTERAKHFAAQSPFPAAPGNH